MKKNTNLNRIVVIAISSVYALVYYIKIDTFAFAGSLNFLLMLFVSILGLYCLVLKLKKSKRAFRQQFDRSKVLLGPLKPQYLWF